MTDWALRKVLNFFGSLPCPNVVNFRKFELKVMKIISKVVYILASVRRHCHYLRNIRKLAIGQIEKPNFQRWSLVRCTTPWMGFLIRVENCYKWLEIHLKSEKLFQPIFGVECHHHRPPRCHHCPVCDICILKRNHHCFFTGACIGLGNQKNFILFLLWDILGIIYALFHITPLLSKVWWLN